MTDAPLVSCVMPTRDRRAFARQAIWYFLRQDYPSKELVVLDDGDDAIADLTHGDERIRYVRLPRSDVGAKRNLGCQLATGEFVAQWDDDDWMGYNRLSAQVSELTAAGADIHACGELLHYRVDAGDAWLLRPRWPDAPDLPPGPLLCRRSLAAEHRFAASGSGEQHAFVAGLAPDRVYVGDAPWYLAVVHRTNLAGRSLDDGRWTARPFGEVVARLGTDEIFYAGLRNGIGPERPGVRAADLTLASFFRSWDGYGFMAEYLALGMRRAGASLALAPLGVDHTGLTEEMRHLLAGGLPAGGPVLWFAQPEGVAGAFPHARDVFINTMWEADRLPHGWAGPLNAARGVIVPTRFVAAVCRRSGVRSPVDVVPQGADPELYPYVERSRRPGLTTLVVATLSGRKHPAEAVAGWQRAFAGDPEARLILKGKLGVDFPVADPRIEVVTETEHTRGIAHWYERADVLLALGNEGFGLPLVEGMATGLPVIALSSEGQGDVCADAGPLVLDVPPARWERADDTHYGPAGVRGVPDIDAVAARLRWVAEHRDEARDLGRQASAWAHRERNAWDMGPAMLEVMERRLRRPLRRVRTLWQVGAPSLRPYTSALAAGLGGVRVVSAPPEVAGLRLLHVQHSGDMDGDVRALTRIVEAAARVPVIVTPLWVRTVVCRALAAAVEGHLRAWYLAAAATGPDETVAEALAAAAADAQQRSGYGASARTWRRAAELTADHGVRASRLLHAANDAYLAGDSGAAVAWCQEALTYCHGSVFAAEAELILGRARTWAGDPLRAFDGLVRAAAAIGPVNPGAAAALLAEATVPAAMTGRVHLARQVAQQAEELWEDTGSVTAGAGASLTVLAMVAEAFALAGELDRAACYQLRAAALPSAGEAGEQQGVAFLAQVDIWTERYEQGRLRLGAIVDTGRHMGTPAILSLALGLSGELAWWTGRWTSGYADATEALQCAEETNQVGLIGHALSQLSRIAAARGDREQCQEHVERARQDVEPHGVGCLAVYTTAALGLCALSCGDLITAIDHLNRACDAAEAAGLGNPNVVPCAGDLAEALARAGARDQAEHVLAWLQNRAEATGLIYPRAAAARVRGILARDPAEAETWFARACAAHEMQPMPFEQARTLLCQGEALRRARHPAAARGPLRRALTIFSGLGAQPWAARVITELNATGVRAGARHDTVASALGSLSPQELQVARAVGQGLNNVEAAAALFVSRKTVEAHLTRAYRKLGVRSRTELTRLMITHDQAANPVDGQPPPSAATRP